MDTPPVFGSTAPDNMGLGDANKLLFILTVHVWKICLIRPSRNHLKISQTAAQALSIFSNNL
jgi:hypothetical protein